MQTYKGSCHCGTVTFEANIELGEVISCNCSHCKRKGFLLSFVSESAFRLLSGKESLTEYRFHKKTIAHLFCKVCGIQGFARAESPEGTMVAINMRCLEGVDIEALTLKKINGQDF